MKSKSSLRQRADRAKKHRCKNLIAVLENPKTVVNIGSVIRNVDALGVEKLYVVDGYNLLPDGWQEMRARRSLLSVSVSAVKWSYVRRFSNTRDCLEYLTQKNFISFATSPHQKGKQNKTLEEAKFTAKRVAVWFGNESRGLSEEVLTEAKECLQINMCGIIESLNLGTSTGIVLYEAARQRREYAKHKI